MYKDSILSIIVVIMIVVIWSLCLQLTEKKTPEQTEETTLEVTDTEKDSESGEEEKPILTVVCYGDSNTWGNNPEDSTRYPKDIRWPGVLSDMLGRQYDVISEGLNGRQTGVWFDDIYPEDGLVSLPMTLKTDYPVDILIFMLGTNDCKIRTDIPADDIGVGIEELIHCAKDDLSELQDFEPKIIVVSPPAILECVTDSWLANQFDENSIQKSQELKNVYQKLCERENCIFVNGTDTIEVSDIDGVHLSEKGHKQLAELLCETIQNLEKDQPETKSE